MPTSDKIELNPSTRVGWKCPECHACHSPDVSTCERCAPPYYARPTQPFVPVTPYTPWWGVHPPNWYHDGQWWTIISSAGASPEED